MAPQPALEFLQPSSTAPFTDEAGTGAAAVTRYARQMYSYTKRQMEEVVAVLTESASRQSPHNPNGYSEDVIAPTKSGGGGVVVVHHSNSADSSRPSL